MFKETMCFDYSETQEHVATAAKKFAEQHIRPHIMEWDEAQTFPVELFKKAGEMGFMGVLVPEECVIIRACSFSIALESTVYEFKQSAKTLFS